MAKYLQFFKYLSACNYPFPVIDILSRSKRSIWNGFVDAITILWLGLFIISQLAFGSFLVSISLKVLLSFFIADIILAYLWSNLGPFQFVRKRWLDILMVIPFFRPLRIFRVLRLGRVARSLRIAKATKDYFEITKELKRIAKALKKILR